MPKGLNGLFSAKSTGTARPFKVMQGAGAFSGRTDRNHNPFTSKLRWVCGLCGVPCKDENGFKCHLMSEKHITREAAQADHVDKHGPRKSYHLDDFSKQFEQHFINVLIGEHLNCKMPAHQVYKDMFPPKGDRAMENMQKTCWGTLGHFIVYLRDRARVMAQRSEKGWKVWISQDMLDEKGDVYSEDEVDPVDQAKKEAISWDEVPTGTKRRAGIDEKIVGRVEASKAKAARSDDAVVINRSVASNIREDASKVAFGMSMAKKKLKTGLGTAVQMQDGEVIPEDGEAQAEPPSEDNWAAPRMVVKVIDKRDRDWHKRKAKVLSARASEAELEAMDDAQARRWANIDMLETVIPTVGRTVQVCGGEHKGRVGQLLAMKEADFCATVGLLDGTQVDGLQYEWICKVV